MNVHKIKTTGDCLKAIEKARQTQKWSSVDYEQKMDTIRQLRIAGSNEVADSILMKATQSHRKAKRAENLLAKLKDKLAELQTPPIPMLEKLLTN